MARISNEPKLRQYLVLAYQIQDVIYEGRAKDLYQIAEWLGITYTRIKQIMNLLFLCPEIQKETLLSYNNNIHKVTERKIRHITKEIDWKKQILAWNKLTQ